MWACGAGVRVAFDYAITQVLPVTFDYAITQVLGGVGLGRRWRPLLALPVVLVGATRAMLPTRFDGR